MASRQHWTRGRGHLSCAASSLAKPVVAPARSRAVLPVLFGQNGLVSETNMCLPIDYLV